MYSAVLMAALLAPTDATNCHRRARCSNYRYVPCPQVIMPMTPDDDSGTGTKDSPLTIEEQKAWDDYVKEAKPEKVILDQTNDEKRGFLKDIGRYPGQKKDGADKPADEGKPLSAEEQKAWDDYVKEAKPEKAILDQTNDEKRGFLKDIGRYPGQRKDGNNDQSSVPMDRSVAFAGQVIGSA